MRIFVTGAAGLLGGALVAALARAGHSVVGLVHREANIRGNDGRSVGALPFDGAVPPPGGVAAMRGDVRMTELGLDRFTIASLSAHIDLVIHCAGLVRFEANAAELEAVNVDGTRHIATLFNKARMIHVSTAYVCGLKNGPVAEAPRDPAYAFGNGYERSKADAEAALLRWRSDAVIVRPSIIVGEAATGRIRDFDTIYQAFKFVAEGRIGMAPVAPLASLNFVPIDHVVDGICDLVRHNVLGPEIIHLVARHAVRAADLLRLIADISASDHPLSERRRAHGGALQDMAERFAQPYWNYLQRHPEFETRALARLSGREAPDMDEAALVRQLRYCIDAGFIRIGRSAELPALAS